MNLHLEDSVYICLDSLKYTESNLFLAIQLLIHLVLRACA